MLTHACLSLFSLLAGQPASAPEPPRVPVVTVEADNTRVTESCVIRIAADAVIADADGDGVIHIAADGITVEFDDGAVLRGAGATDDDQLTGIGVRIDGHKNVTLRRARIEGFKVGIRATAADGLVIEGGAVTRNFRQRLKSTPFAEDASDWLWPHRNDDGEWLRNYGAAAAIERSRGIAVRGLVVRNSQNGIVLDRVDDSVVCDADCSFLSGWGLAMWRSSGNLVSRNAFDFCIRGYSHGVYNRGQDSAGILCFEQCSRNQFIENSATHSGDGFFGFAGREALGEGPPPPGSDGSEFDYTSRGCNANLLFANDFSFAAAHGIELTFSFDNQFIANRLVGDAICGVWAGYSQRTLISENVIENCGDPARGTGAEGGGVNIEHGADNVIAGNRFTGNSRGIALWDDDDGALLKTPWARANHRGSVGAIIASNTFTDQPAFLWQRRTTATVLFDNTLAGTSGGPDSDEQSSASQVDQAPKLPPPIPVREPAGQKRPVGARALLTGIAGAGGGGRDAIVMHQWGPWDHQSPMMRLSARYADRSVHEIYGPAGAVVIDVLEGKGDLETILSEVEDDKPRILTLQPRAGISVLPYAVRVRTRNGSIDQTLRGTLMRSPWTASVFTSPVDPRTDIEAWRAAARSPQAVAIACDDLSWMRFGRRGPRDLPLFRDSPDRAPGNTNFGVIARTRLALPAGRWRISTLSDDGVRVMVDGRTVVENWTHHAPARDTGVFEHAAAAVVEITVEYFQLDGYATFEFGIEPEPAGDQAR